MTKEHGSDGGHERKRGGGGEPHLRQGVPGLDTHPQPQSPTTKRPTIGQSKTEPKTLKDKDRRT